MDIKTLITSNYSNVVNIDDDYRKIDKEIGDFILEINKSDDIKTFYSCAGHTRYKKLKNGDTDIRIDNPYLFFNVSPKGWNIFWLEVLPELASKIHVKVEIDDNRGIVIRGFRNYKNGENFFEYVSEIFLKYFR